MQYAVLALALFTTATAADKPYLAWRSECVDVSKLPASLGTLLDEDELAALASQDPLPPHGDATVGLRAPDGEIWLGSPRGLMRRATDEPRWRLFHSRRWLPDNHVQDLALDDKGALWVQTPSGACRIWREETALARKIDGIQRELRRSHMRHGLVGAIHVNEPGDVASEHSQPSNDNDGLWTSLYVAAEAFRYAVTGDESAKQNAWQSLEALMFLEEVTGISGFAARSIVPGDEEDPNRYGGEWHRSADDRWWWKGDTSSDELDGHYFAYAIYYDLAATEAEREKIRGVVARMTDHLIDHGYYYVGPSGKPTTWGVFAPERLNHDTEWILDRGLNSLEMLSHLKVAEHVTGESRFRERAADLIEKHAYHTNTIRQKILWPPEAVNHSDDELAFLAYYPLVLYERDPELRKVYLMSLERSFQIERPETSPLFNYTYAAGQQASTWTDPQERPTAPMIEPEAYDRDACLAWFREVPEDLFRWAVTNSGRQDLGETITNRFGRTRSRFVLPIAERGHMRWNGDPYELDVGGGGSERDDGAFILLPYWMGRYHRFLE